MELFIFRHGEAGSSKSDPKADYERPLTPAGIRVTRLAAGGLKALKCRPNLIATSPLVRGRQTADILAKVLRAPEPVLCEELAPEADVRKAIRWLRSLDCDSVMLVGHMPHLRHLLSAMIFKDSGAEISLAKSGASCVLFDGPPRPGEGRLLWLLLPEHLSAIGRHSPR